jgi:hypothetical protein
VPSWASPAPRSGSTAAAGRHTGDRGVEALRRGLGEIDDVPRTPSMSTDVTVLIDIPGSAQNDS